MTSPIKRPTAWRSPSGTGYVVTPGSLGIITNLGLPIVTNSLIPIVTTPSYTKPKFLTQWSNSPGYYSIEDEINMIITDEMGNPIQDERVNMDTPNPTAWRPPTGQGSVITIGTLAIVTNLGLPIVTNSLIPIVTTPSYTKPKNATAWEQTG